MKNIVIITDEPLSEVGKLLDLFGVDSKTHLFVRPVKEQPKPVAVQKPRVDGIAPRKRGRPPVKKPLQGLTMDEISPTNFDDLDEDGII